MKAKIKILKSKKTLTFAVHRKGEDGDNISTTVEYIDIPREVDYDGKIYPAYKLISELDLDYYEDHIQFCLDNDVMQDIDDLIAVLQKVKEDITEKGGQ